MFFFSGNYATDLKICFFNLETLFFAHSELYTSGMNGEKQKKSVRRPVCLDYDDGSHICIRVTIDTFNMVFGIATEY